MRGDGDDNQRCGGRYRLIASQGDLLLRTSNVQFCRPMWRLMLLSGIEMLQRTLPVFVFVCIHGLGDASLITRLGCV